jgi:hypothetical protein
MLSYPAPPSTSNERWQESVAEYTKKERDGRSDMSRMKKAIEMIIMMMLMMVLRVRTNNSTAFSSASLCVT